MCNLETFVCVSGNGEKRKPGWRSVNARERPRWKERGWRSKGPPSRQFTSTSKSPSGWHNKRLVSLYCLFFSVARVFNDLRASPNVGAACLTDARQKIFDIMRVFKQPISTSFALLFLLLLSFSLSLV